MTIALFLGLVEKVGLPLAEKAYELYQRKDDVITPAEIEELRKLANYTSEDALKKAGIQIVDGKVVKL